MDNVSEERRKHRRYELKYVAHLVVHSGDLVSHLDAVGRNASVGGLLLETRARIRELSRVSFVMTLESGSLARSVELTGDGIVVRTEALCNRRFLIAVECKRPITQFEEDFPPAAESTS